MPAVRKTNQVAYMTRSFGFKPEDSRHHFLVNIPKSNKESVEISEHLTWDDIRGSGSVSLGNEDDGQIRVILPRLKWDAIADEVRAEFNKRLKKLGRRAGSWREGKNVMRRELGKELVLLAWAIEDADPGLVPTAVANWMGLVPEERWWMYTQTAAGTGDDLTTRYTYNQWGQRTSETDPRGNTSTTVYDNQGYPRQEIDSFGNATTYAFFDGQLYGTTDTDGNSTSFSYDAFGNVNGVTQSNHKAGTSTSTSFVYNSFGDLIGTTDADGNTRTIHYDVPGRIMVIVRTEL